MSSGLKEQREPQFGRHSYPSLAKPYLVFVGDVTDPLDAKTATGFVHWRPDWCAGQLRLSADAVDVGLPAMSVPEARERGITTLLVGVSPLGGGLSPRWVSTMVDALDAGMDIVSGLHQRLSDQPEIAGAIAATGGAYTNCGTPPGRFPWARRAGERASAVSPSDRTVASERCSPRFPWTGR